MVYRFVAAARRTTNPRGRDSHGTPDRTPSYSRPLPRIHPDARLVTPPPRSSGGVPASCIGQGISNTNPWPEICSSTPPPRTSGGSPASCIGQGISNTNPWPEICRYSWRDGLSRHAGPPISPSIRVPRTSGTGSQWGVVKERCLLPRRPARAARQATRRRFLLRGVVDSAT